LKGRVAIVGAGPAGASAALAALRESARVVLYEKSQFPRHKVCGEFLSPELPLLLDRLGVSAGFLALRPSRITRARLHFGGRTKQWVLAEPAFGLSRFAFDDLLLRTALARGAELRRENAPAGMSGPVVMAHGRRTAAEKGSRLFGFKAHFSGSCGDGVDLVFFDRVYAGVSEVEGGAVNVCGLAPESSLRACGFDPGELLARSPVLRDLVGPLSRRFDWLVTGPLVFREQFDAQPGGEVYAAGDALGFVDPFTGSGVLSAVLTGSLAGEAATRADDPAVHLARCRRALRVQYRTAGLLRAVVENGWAGRLVGLVPGSALFRWTRPRIPDFGA
jgi:menaquinone-9 beta-reductase